MDKQPGIVEIFTDDEVIARIIAGDKQLYAGIIKNTMHAYTGWQWLS